jgi:hypothetical protein
MVNDKRNRSFLIDFESPDQDDSGQCRLSNLYSSGVFRFPGLEAFLSPHRDNGAVVNAKLGDIGGSFYLGSFRYGFHVSSTFYFIRQIK